MWNFIEKIEELKEATNKNKKTWIIISRDLIWTYTWNTNPGTLSNNLKYNSSKIRRIKRWMYSIWKLSSYVVANRLIEPSYISLERVLSEEWIIPEFTTSITSITTKNWTIIHNDYWRFEYRHLNDKLFFGFHINSDWSYIADIEKAILDYIYLNWDLFTLNGKIIRAINREDFNYINDNIILQFRSVRFQWLDKINWEKLFEYANMFWKTKVISVVKALRMYYKSPVYEFHI